MLVANKDLTSIYLIWICLSVNHSKRFRDLTFVVHLLKILNQMACAVVFSLNLVHLHYFICVFVFFHGIHKGRFSNGQVILKIFVLVAILAFTR